MLYVIVVANPDTAQERLLSSYFDASLKKSGCTKLPYELKYLSDAYSEEADKLLSDMEGNLSGILFVATQDDLWKHPISNFTNRVGRSSVKMSGVPAGILVSGKNESHTKKLAGDILKKLLSQRAYTLPPAYNENEGATLIERMVDALRRMTA